jgi:hypothetical protein
MRSYTRKEMAKTTAGAVAALVVTGGLSCWQLHFYRPDKR